MSFVRNVSRGLALLGLMAASSVLAQEATFEPATLLLEGADGEQLEYSVGDASFYVSTSAGYDDVPASVDFSLSLSSVTPIDAALLEWSSQAEGRSKTRVRSITIVGTPGGEEGGEELRYEVSDAEVTSVSITQSTYASPSVSLSLSAGDLVINGVAMN
jgi:hypothetical protein